MTNTPDNFRNPTSKVSRAQESGHDGYRAESDDELGDLDVYEALIDPNGAAGKGSKPGGGGSPMMMPPGTTGGRAGGAGSA